MHGSYSGCLLQRSGWTRNVDMFFQCLSAIPFSDGGGFNNVAVAEGLAEALMMFSSPNGSQTQQNAEGQRHCILVAASNPHLLPTPVYGPVMQILEQSGNIEAHTSNGLADAETVAKAFPQCSVSLSVICPRKLPKLRSIYNAGKRDHQAADPPVDTSNNPNFLVLISENFNEACAAFSHTEMESLAPNQSLVEMDMSSVPPVSVVTLPAAQSDYVICWEGNIYIPRLSEPVRLQGYKSSSASELLAANWPPTMQIHSIISLNKLYASLGQRIGRADVLVFRVMEPHALLSHLQKKNWCAIISLPSQTLYLGVSDKVSRLIGFLFPSENTEFKPTIPNQQLGATPLPQLQQQERAQPLLEQLQQQQAQQQRAQPLKRKNDVPLQPLLKIRRIS